MQFCKEFFVTSYSNSIRHPLRRTLVHSVHYSVKEIEHPYR